MASLRSIASFIKQQTSNHPTNRTVGSIASSPFAEDTLPRMVSSVVATTTRSPTLTEVRYSASKQLQVLYHDPTFWERLIKALDCYDAWIAVAKQDLKDPRVRAWTQSLDPQTTHHSLGPTLYSEEDAVDHSVARFLHPATRIIQAMADYKGVHEDSRPIMSITSACATQLQSKPDRVFHLLDLIKAINDIKSIIEFKTPNSLDDDDFALLFRCFENMQQELGETFPIPFQWTT